MKEEYFFKTILEKDSNKENNISLDLLGNRQKNFFPTFNFNRNTFLVLFSLLIDRIKHLSHPTNTT